MTRKELSTTKAVAVLAYFAVSAASATLLALSPLALANSMGLSPALVMGQAFSSGAYPLGAVPSETFGYDLYNLLSTNQGLPNCKATLRTLFNPGADIDLTTTTDFEDLAAPAADIVEFTDQDRALAADYMSSTLL
jgi:hypothetical protein